jgi:hypothetical protein
LVQDSLTQVLVSKLVLSETVSTVVSSVTASTEMVSSVVSSETASSVDTVSLDQESLPQLQQVSQSATSSPVVASLVPEFFKQKERSLSLSLNHTIITNNPSRFKEDISPP